VDLCPDIAGTVQNHGCPEIKKEITEKINFVSHNILFATKSDILSPKSFAALDELVKILKTHPELHLTVEGHTDNVGTAEHNLTLSQNRADAIKIYLLKKGIPDARLTTVGMGMEKPKADNSTSEGRSINRRVELKLTSQ
jgi:outer membrane protein OmpA-like peptidoglycan-associated protein